MRTDYLKFDASSIQELLRRKLIESSAYNGQLYPGSDTRILLDLFAWTFDALTYILNNTASDVLFEDTQVYENLNRLVKLLSYNPKGYRTSYTEFSISGNNLTRSNSWTIPRFSSIDTGKRDKNGKPIKYSFISDYSFNSFSGNIVTPRKYPILYNGYFSYYEVPTLALGIPYEIIALDGIGPQSSLPKKIDHDNIYVFVERILDSGEKEIIEYKPVNNLVLDSSYDSHHCEIRLCENYEYQIKFGDDIHGKKLESGNKIHILYLVSNEEEGVLDSAEVSSDQISIEIENLSDFSKLIEICYGSTDLFKMKYAATFVRNGLPISTCNNIILTNITNSSKPIDYETTEEIKNNAPSSHRLGNRLVTTDDFVSYINNNFSSKVQDVYVCNNTEYMLYFYRWLDKHDALNINIRLSNYTYASSCDFNNIYIWMKSNYGTSLANADVTKILSECDKIKTATSNLIPCNPIKGYVIPYVEDKRAIFDISEEELSSSWQSPCVFQIKKKETYISNEQIISEVSHIIKSYFKKANETLGFMINLSDLQQQIYDLGYIDNIRTVNKINDSNQAWVSGLSFAYFTPMIVNYADWEIITQIKQLEKFQYCELLNADQLISNIEIINENTFTLKASEF